MKINPIKNKQKMFRDRTIRSYTTLILYFGILLVLVACTRRSEEPTLAQVDLLNTAAAQTVAVQQTHLAETALTVTIEPPGQDPSQTTDHPETPTMTSEGTTVPRCDQAAFVAETIPDGSKFNPSREFVKTWTLRNSGTCTWNANYQIIFTDGVSMGAPASKQLTTGSVAPGETIEIALSLRAPISAGKHRGDFKLRNADGALFGIGEKGGPFWVEITVEGTLYDFAKNYCAPGVTWTSGAGSLPCPGTANDSRGWVIYYDDPILEDGYHDDEPGLQVHPQKVNQGSIKGIYPPIAITENVYFKAIVGCYSDANCNVKFKLNVIVDSGTEQTLATWVEIQDGRYQRVQADLSRFAGKNVQFILLVEASGSAADDLALWFVPRIEP